MIYPLPKSCRITSSDVSDANMSEQSALDTDLESDPNGVDERLSSLLRYSIRDLGAVRKYLENCSIRS